MYFAVNKPSAELLSQALTCLQANSARGRWFALLDRAFDHKCGTSLRWPNQTEAIYKGTEEIEALSPTLLALTTQSTDILAKEIARLVRHCEGRPMLSFVQTPLRMSDLVGAWQDIKWVHTQDGLRFLLRFADIRVLPSLEKALQPHNWERLCQPLHAWHVVDRVGTLQPLRISMPGHAETAMPRSQDFQIDDKELALLLDAAQPDVLINTLFEQIPDVLPTGPDLAEVHAWVRGAWDLATSHRLDATIDQLALAAATCLTEGRMLNEPALHDLLAQYQPGTSSLADELAELLPIEEEVFL